MFLRFTATCLIVLQAAIAHGGVGISPRVLDFGERGHGERPQLELTLTNDGRTPLRVMGIRASCSCITVRPARITGAIPPGKSVTLTVTMSSGRAMGRLDKYIEIRTDGPGQPRKVPTRMRVFEDLDMEPRQLQFAGEVDGEAVTRSVEIFPRRKSTKSPPLTVEVKRITTALRPSVDKDTHFTYRVEDSNRGKRIQVTLKPTHPEGRLSATLEAQVNGRPFRIPITGDMFRGIKISPKYFNFNRVDVDDVATLTEESRLKTIDGRAFKVISSDFEVVRTPAPGVELEVTPEKQESGSEWILRARLRLPPGIPPNGSFFGKVRVRTDHPEKPNLELNFFGFFP